jgi:hypothetical protein
MLLIFFAFLCVLLQTDVVTLELLVAGVALALAVVTLTTAAGATALVLVALYLRSLPCHPQDSAALRYNAGGLQDTVGLVIDGLRPPPPLKTSTCRVAAGGAGSARSHVSGMRVTELISQI